jgi:DNA-binding protein YbaB
MSPGESPRGPQGGGELSGLLRHAEALQRDLDKALADLQSETVEAQDAARSVTVRLTGDGGAKEIRLHSTSLPDSERKALEDALTIAIRLAIERMFELRKQRAAAVTKGLSMPRLFL